VPRALKGGALEGFVSLPLSNLVHGPVETAQFRFSLVEEIQLRGKAGRQVADGHPHQTEPHSGPPLPPKDLHRLIVDDLI
jgi:hypothetical protein